MAKAKEKSIRPKAAKPTVDEELLAHVGEWAARKKHDADRDTARLLRMLQSAALQCAQRLSSLQDEK